MTPSSARGVAGPPPLLQVARNSAQVDGQVFVEHLAQRLSNTRLYLLAISADLDLLVLVPRVSQLCDRRKRNLLPVQPVHFEHTAQDPTVEPRR